MNPLKNNLMIIFIINCLLFTHAMCNIEGDTKGKDETGNAEDLVLVAEKQIKFYSNGKLNAVVNVGLPTMTAAAYDPIKKDLYVSESFEDSGRIFRIQTTKNTAYNVTPIVKRQAEPVRGLFYNHLNSTLYWTMPRSISYVQLLEYDIPDPFTGQVLFELESQNPRDITIDVHNEYVYWVNFGLLTTTIERSLLDGTNRKTLADGLSDPRSLTFDEKTNTLYYTESQYNGPRNLYCIENDSKPTLIHTTDSWNPFVITLHNRNIYWIDSVSGELWVRPKNMSYSPTLVSQDKLNDRALRLFMMSGYDAKQPDKKRDANEVKMSKSCFRSMMHFGMREFKRKMSI